MNWDLGWADFVSATSYSDVCTSISARTRPHVRRLHRRCSACPAAARSSTSTWTWTSSPRKFRLSLEGRRAVRMDGRRVLRPRRDGDNHQFVPLNQLDGIAAAGAVRQHRRHAGDALPSRARTRKPRSSPTLPTSSTTGSSSAPACAGRATTRTSRRTSWPACSADRHTPNTSSEDVFTWSVTPQFQISRRRDGVRARCPPATSRAARTSSPSGLPSQVDSSTLTNYELGLKSAVRRQPRAVRPHRLPDRIGKTSRWPRWSTASPAWSTPARPAASGLEMSANVPSHRRPDARPQRAYNDAEDRRETSR